MLNAPCYSTEKFNYIKKTNTFVAEISDLPGRVVGRLYDDSIDIGMSLVSHRTGRTVDFCLTDEIKNDEGELLWLTFEPVKMKWRRTGMKVRVYND